MGWVLWLIFVLCALGCFGKAAQKQGGARYGFVLLGIGIIILAICLEAGQPSRYEATLEAGRQQFYREMGY